LSATKTKPQAGGLGASKDVGTGQSSNDCDDTPSSACALGPASCSRFDKCNAPICPLDPHWQLRRHLDNEPVCGLLLELAKDGGEATLRACVPGEVASTVVTVAPDILRAHGPVRRACERAIKSGSRLRNFAAQRATAGEARGR
jgi:hypothetical protein